MEVPTTIIQRVVMAYGSTEDNHTASHHGLWKTWRPSYSEPSWPMEVQKPIIQRAVMAYAWESRSQSYSEPCWPMGVLKTIIQRAVMAYGSPDDNHTASRVGLWESWRESYSDPPWPMGVLMRIIQPPVMARVGIKGVNIQIVNLFANRIYAFIHIQYIQYILYTNDIYCIHIQYIMYTNAFWVDDFNLKKQ